MDKTLDDKRFVNNVDSFSSVDESTLFKKLNVVILGNFSAPYSTENDLAWSFERLGHNVVKIREDSDSTEYLLAESHKADLVIWLHTHGWNMKGRYRFRDVLINIKRRIPVVAYHLDLWLGLQRQIDLRRSPYFQVSDFFTVDKRMAEFMNNSQRYPKGYFLKAGVVERDCYYGTKRKQLTTDIVFTGSGIYHQEWLYRKQLINWLHENYKDNFKHYGSGGLPAIRQAKLNDLYASAKIVIGDTLCKNFNYPEYLSDRIFEVTGRGGFIIHPYITGLEDSFVIDKEIVTYTYGDFDELKDKIEYYLKHDKEREAIRKAGHERTKKDHTYTNRVKHIIKELGLT